MRYTTFSLIDLSYVPVVTNGSSKSYRHCDMRRCLYTNKTQVISGSSKFNLIVWDINTGSDLHLLSGNIREVVCVKVNGSTDLVAVSGHTLNFQNV